MAQRPSANSSLSYFSQSAAQEDRSISSTSAQKEVEESVPTAFGIVRVAVWGDRQRHPIVTVHDIGLDAGHSFQNFFQYQTAHELTKRFCIYNINVLGQDYEHRTPLPDNLVFPSMDGLAQIVQSVVDHFKLSTFIGMGIGAGANVLLRYSLAHNTNVDALILINATITRAGWTEWAYQKMNIIALRLFGVMTQSVVDYLMWHHFGRHQENCNPDTILQYRHLFWSFPNPKNLAAFVEKFLWRTDVVLRDPCSTDPYLLNVPVLQIVGSDSSSIDDTIHVNSQLNPRHSEWLKIHDSSGLVLEDQPEEVTRSIMLFLQGLGYMPSVNVHRVFDELKKAHYDQGRIATTVESSKTGYAPIIQRENEDDSR